MNIKNNKLGEPFQLISSEEKYKNPWIQVREDQVIRPDGKKGIFGVIEKKSGSTVLAMNKEKEVFLVKEYKYGLGRESIELMSGAIETGESPLDAAKRELKEELGIEASEWIDLGVVDPFTTTVNSQNYIFLASGLSEVATSPDDGEVLEVFKVPFYKAVEMVMNSEITHGASCVLILKVEKYMER